MKSMKKAISVVLALLLTVGTIFGLSISVGAHIGPPLVVKITDHFGYRILVNGTIEITQYYGEESSIVIPSEIDGYKVAGIAIGQYNNSSFARNPHLIDVTIEEGIEYIESYAFYDCNNLKSITLPDSLRYVDWDAFHGTAWYEDQPDGLVYAGKVAYKYKGECPEELTIKDGTVGISAVAFSGCSDLKRISFPDTIEIVGGSAFNGTAWYADQPDGMIYIGKAAYRYKGDCPSEIVIKEGTKSISDSAFSKCTSLETVVLPDSITDIGHGAFWHCSALSSINLPDGIKKIGQETFEDCSSLKVIKLPASILYIDSFAFAGCTSLENFIIPDKAINLNPYGSLNTTAWFANQPDGIVYFGKSVYTYKGDCPEQITVEDGTLCIAEDAFLGLSGLKSITIPSSVKFIESKSIGYLRGEFDRLKKSEDLTVIGYSGSAAEEYANENEFTFVSLGQAPTEAPTAPRFILGDVDGDDEVTILDATAIQRYLANLPTTAYAESAADADGDGEVTILDATAIQRHLANLSANEDIGKAV